MKTCGHRVRFVVATLLLLVGAVLIARNGDVGSGASRPFHVAVGTMAIGWLIALSLRSVTPRSFWIVAVAVRLILMPAQPGADMHRYIWEGRIQMHGSNPYKSAPNTASLHELRDANWSQVEFKDATAIYPPLTELGFRMLAAISESVWFFKLAFVVADLAVCLLLSRRFGCARAVLYAWNPLVLHAFAAGGHFDSWCIVAWTAAWLCWEQKARETAAVFLAIATATKWIAFPVLAWSVWQIIVIDGRHKALRAICAALLVFAIPWLAITRGDIGAPLFPKEFVLYARSFGVIPTVLLPLFPNVLWQNKAYLVAIAAAALLLMRSRELTLLSERWLVLLLLLSPMVHAWYFTWLVPFAVLTRNVGVIAVSIAGFAYFGITALPGAPQTGWPLLFAQTGAIWLPFICGVAWTEYRRRHRRKEFNGIREYATDVRLLPT